MTTLSSSQQQQYSFPSPAKINLFLHITGRRANGYHDLQTVFQFLDYGDTLYITPTQDGIITLNTEFVGVPSDDNLIVKAAKLLQQASQSSYGATISIDKILPMGGGLGGGSSNAATVLLALNKLWHTNFSQEELAKLGLSLGADVPIFIYGHAAFAEGVGEEFTQVTPAEPWYLITKPQLNIATASVFTAADLTRNTAKISPQHWDLNNCHNDCENWVIKHHPEVANLMAWLVEYAPARMTGTGSCIFSTFSSQQEARSIQDKLPSGIESFVAKGVNTSPLMKVINAL